MDNNFIDSLLNQHLSLDTYPSAEMVRNWFDSLLGLIFPEFCHTDYQSKKELIEAFEANSEALDKILSNLNFTRNDEVNLIIENFKATIPELKLQLDLDRKAMLAGDPAAVSLIEVTKTYPGFYAISAYRIGNTFFKMDVPLLPRLITEIAHSKTGIDIHPGANIGASFCIDHGTGIVIGETSIIGNHVKIYQGVTLGALSVEKEDAAKKRHPTINDHVIIYAGATILGGETIVGHNSIIGGNVWLTRSVPDNSKVYYKTRVSDSEGEDLILIK
jgi:serine O-acetyltransferase